MAKYFFKRAAMLMALAAVVIASGCNQTVNTGTTTVAVTGIELNKGELPLKVDESKKLVATVMPANATNKQVTWASDKPAVATVSQDGTVTAKKEGTAQITVKTVNGGKTANCKIIVTAKDPTPTAEFTVEMTHGEHGTISADPDIIGGKAAKDSVITFTALPETGYEVDKWSITPDFALIEGGTRLSKTAKVKITTNTTVTVSFKKISYKVTFDAKGGLPVPTEQHVLYKEKASVPTEQLIKKGYILEDWFNKDGDALWDFAVNEVTKDTELYAKWKAKTDTVNFNVDGGDGNLTATLNGSSFTGGEVEHGNTVEFRAKPKEGYKVDKWSITPDSALIEGGTWISKTAKVKITGNTTVTVSFKKKEYWVFFNANGGSPEPKFQKVLYKEKASAPTEQPTKDGYDLEGWFNKDGDALWDFAVNEVTKDTELYAKWKAKTDMAYTVQHLQQNISDDKYTVIDTENKTGTTDTMTVAAAKNYPGFTAQAVTQQTIKGDGTTIVQIKYDRNEITLTLDLNDLNISNPHVIKKVKGRYGAPVTVAEEPTCSGYKFIGWSPDLPATFPETDSSHTAQWKSRWE